MVLEVHGHGPCLLQLPNAVAGVVVKQTKLQLRKHLRQLHNIGPHAAAHVDHSVPGTAHFCQKLHSSAQGLEVWIVCQGSRVPLAALPVLLRFFAVNTFQYFFVVNW